MMSLARMRMLIATPVTGIPTEGILMGAIRTARRPKAGSFRR